MSVLGEKIFQHYELFLGSHIGADRYTNNEYGIQILGFDKVFEDSITFASFGLSKYSGLIGNLCEVVMAVDDDYDYCADILANALFYVVQEHMDFGRGTLIGGIDEIANGFWQKHNKTALYFTGTYILPEAFSIIDDNCKMYMAFFVSEKEYEYIMKYGCEQFETLLENNHCDVIDINRKSVI